MGRMNKHGLVKVCLGLIILFVNSANADLRDPTQPSGYNSETALAKIHNDLTLTAILTSPQRNIAIINGELLNVGDKIGKFKILKISSQTVFLEGPGGAMDLTLVETFIK